MPGPDQTQGRYASETFHRRDDAHKLACQAETRVDQGLSPNKSSAARLATFGDLIDLHIDDMCAVGKPPHRTQALDANGAEENNRGSMAKGRQARVRHKPN